MAIFPKWIDFSPLYRKAAAVEHAYKSHNLVFFVGAGVSKYFASKMPNWKELLLGLFSEAEIDVSHKKEVNKLINSQKYLTAAEAIKRYIKSDTNDKDLAVDRIISQILKQRIALSGKNPDLHLSILDFSSPIITTNFDTIFESIISELKIQKYQFRTFTYEDEQDISSILTPSYKNDCYVYKLHGSIEKTQKLIFDDGDYFDFYFHQKWPKSLQLLRHLLSTKLVIFIGFSLSDPEVLLILREATRFTNSYQHLAFLESGETTDTELEILRSNYHVDPIIFEDVSMLPLYVLEMRNFFPKTELPLSVSLEYNNISQTVGYLKKEHKISNHCSTILFGSFAKYGRYAPQESDIDILFLTDFGLTNTQVFKSNPPNIEKPIDLTVMSKREFERLLKIGDPFVCSLLVTGSPFEDKDDYYKILSLGFSPSYSHDTVLENMLIRYETRWLKYCSARVIDISIYLQSFAQWMITFMQLLLLENYYPIDSLLSLSLLGNKRFTIHEFSSRFNISNESYFLSILDMAKDPLAVNETPIPTFQSFLSFLTNEMGRNISQVFPETILPSQFIQKSSPHIIYKIFMKFKADINSIIQGEQYIEVGYAESLAVEKSIGNTYRTIRKEHNSFCLSDLQFFFQLVDFINQNSKGSEYDLCNEFQQRWNSDGINKFSIEQ